MAVTVGVAVSVAVGTAVSVGTAVEVGLDVGDGSGVGVSLGIGVEVGGAVGKTRVSVGGAMVGGACVAWFEEQELSKTNVNRMNKPSSLCFKEIIKYAFRAVVFYHNLSGFWIFLADSPAKNNQKPRFIQTVYLEELSAHRPPLLSQTVSSTSGMITQVSVSGMIGPNSPFSRGFTSLQTSSLLSSSTIQNS